MINESINKIEAERKVYKTIQDILSVHEMELINFNIMNDNVTNNNKVNIIESELINLSHDHINNDIIETNNNSTNLNFLITSLTENQTKIFNTIINVTINNIGDKLYFIDGPGGSDKSYLHNVIIEYLKSLNISILTMAWTGITANLLIDGKTVHNIFKLPLDINE